MSWLGTYHREQADGTWGARLPARGRASRGCAGLLASGASTRHRCGLSQVLAKLCDKRRGPRQRGGDVRIAMCLRADTKECHAFFRGCRSTSSRRFFSQYSGVISIGSPLSRPAISLRSGSSCCVRFWASWIRRRMYSLVVVQALAVFGDGLCRAAGSAHRLAPRTTSWDHL